MKKKTIFVIIGIVIALALAAVLLFFKTNDNITSSKRLIEKSVADVSTGTVEEFKDTHGGFHGDGEAFIKIKFNDQKCFDSIKNNDKWNPYPLTDSLNSFIYGKTYTKGGTIVSEGPVVTEDIDIPEINNGYYFFTDRGDGQLQSEKTANSVMGGYSYNVTVALYDIDNNILYYYELDT